MTVRPSTQLTTPSYLHDHNADIQDEPQQPDVTQNEPHHRVQCPHIWTHMVFKLSSYPGGHKPLRSLK